MRRPGLAASAPATLALALLTSCGLEYYPYMEPPVLVTYSSATGTVVFESPEDPGVYFQGYEILYKVYATADLAVQAATDMLEDNPDDYDEVAEITAAGFRRLTKEGDEDPDFPLVAIGTTATHGVTVTFPVLGDAPYFFTSLDDTPVLLRRSVEYPDLEQNQYGVYRPFDDCTAEDADLTDDVWQAIYDGQRVYIMLFAASYGMDLDDLVPIYSEPVYLFYIEYLMGVK